jgi:hypothetical protein
MRIKNRLYSNIFYKISPMKLYKYVNEESDLIQAYLYSQSPFWFKWYFMKKKNFIEEQKQEFLKKVSEAENNEKLTEIVYEFLTKELS